MWKLRPKGSRLEGRGESRAKKLKLKFKWCVVMRREMKWCKRNHKEGSIDEKEMCLDLGPENENCRNLILYFFIVSLLPTTVTNDHTIGIPFLGLHTHSSTLERNSSVKYCVCWNVIECQNSWRPEKWTFFIGLNKTLFSSEPTQPSVKVRNYQSIMTDEWLIKRHGKVVWAELCGVRGELNGASGEDDIKRSINRLSCARAQSDLTCLHTDVEWVDRQQVLAINWVGENVNLTCKRLVVVVVGGVSNLGIFIQNNVSHSINAILSSAWLNGAMVCSSRPEFIDTWKRKIANRVAACESDSFYRLSFAFGLNRVLNCRFCSRRSAERRKECWNEIQYFQSSLVMIISVYSPSLCVLSFIFSLTKKISRLILDLYKIRKKYLISPLVALTISSVRCKCSLERARVSSSSKSVNSIRSLCSRISYLGLYGAETTADMIALWIAFRSLRTFDKCLTVESQKIKNSSCLDSRMKKKVLYVEVDDLCDIRWLLLQDNVDVDWINVNWDIAQVRFLCWQNNEFIFRSSRRREIMIIHQIMNENKFFATSSPFFASLLFVNKIIIILNVFSLIDCLRPPHSPPNLMLSHFSLCL